MKSVLLLALLISVNTVAAAIDCYTCANCGDPFDPNAAGVVKTCPSTSILPNNYCAKIVTSGVVGRICSLNVCSEGCVGDVCTYCCDGNLCNGGNTLTTSFVAMGLALVAAFIFSKQ